MYVSPPSYPCLPSHPPHRIAPVCSFPFQLVASAKDQTAFLAITLLTVLSMSAFTMALGLSDTLGAFLAGVLLAETKYRCEAIKRRAVKRVS